MKLSDLAQVCGCKLEGNGDHDVKDVAKIETATREQVCFVANKQYLPLLEKSRAGAVILQPGMAVPQGMNAMRADDPDLAFSKAVSALRGEPVRPLPGIAEQVVMGKRFEMGEGTSVGSFTYIGDGVKLGKNVVIYPQCFVGDEVVVGDNTVLYPGVKVLERCKVGKSCILYPGVVVGADGFGYHFVAGKFVKAPQRGTVVLEDEVEVGANTTIDRARFDVTVVKKGTKIDNLCQIGHNVQIGANCVIAGLTGIAGSAVLKDYVQVGGHAGIADHVTVGMGAKIAAKTGVMQDVAPGMKMAGTPADDGKLYMQREAAMRRLPQTLEKMRSLEAQVKQLMEKAGLAVPPAPAEGDAQ